MVDFMRTNTHAATPCFWTFWLLNHWFLLILYSITFRFYTYVLCISKLYKILFHFTSLGGIRLKNLYSCSPQRPSEAPAMTPTNAVKQRTASRLLTLWVWAVVAAPKQTTRRVRHLSWSPAGTSGNRSRSECNLHSAASVQRAPSQGSDTGGGRASAR